MEKDKYVDESWKESVEKEKEGKETQEGQSLSGDTSVSPSEMQESAEYGELNFLSYISSLAFQAMIFLGELPNPVTNLVEKNLRQAKFIIDTLAILKEKTAGNLTKQENDMLNASLYELQMRYVELFNKEGIS